MRSRPHAEAKSTAPSATITKEALLHHDHEEGASLGPCGRIIPTDPEALLHTKEAAYLAFESHRTWEGRRLDGTGCPFVQLSARAIRYRRRDVLAWIAAHLRSSTSDTGK